MCLYKNTSGGNHHISNKLMLIWSWGWSSQMPGEFYLFIFLNGGSSAVRSISVQSLLFSEVIKLRIDLLAGDSYLLPPPPVLCFVPLSCPQGGKVWSVWKLEPYTLLQYNIHPYCHWHSSSLQKYNTRGIDLDKQNFFFFSGMGVVRTWVSSCTDMFVDFLSPSTDKTGLGLSSTQGLMISLSCHNKCKHP